MDITIFNNTDYWYQNNLLILTIESYDVELLTPSLKIDTQSIYYNSQFLE